MSRFAVIAVALLLAAPGVASAAPCVAAVTGTSPPRSQWADLEQYAATTDLNPAIRALQPIPSATGEINTDFFSLTIDAAGQTPDALFKELRSNLNEIVFGGGDKQSVAPYDAANDTLWKSAGYKGTVLSFVLDTTFGIPSETGAVVVTCTSTTDWVFSTVSTAKDGVHPVSGNRSFGVLANPDGSLTIFTKATDRVVNQLPYSLLGSKVFAEGEKVWVHMLDNLEKRYAARRPRARTSISLRRTY